MNKSSEYKARKEGTGETTITGLVTPCDWDQNNNIVALEIATSGEETYMVESNAKGEELFKCLHEQVKVAGIVRKDEKGKQLIKVKEYQIVHEQDE